MNESYLLILIILIAVIIKSIASKRFKNDKGLERFTSNLTNVVYYVLIPLAFIYTFSLRGVQTSDLLIIASFLVYLIIGSACFRLMARGWEAGEKNGVFLTSLFPNTVFLGFPISLALFGDVRVASVLGLATIALNVLVPDMMALGRFSVVKLLKLPALIGFIIGVTFNVLSSPTPYISYLLWWSPKALSYSATFVLGLRLPLQIQSLKGVGRPLFISAIYRFLLSPLVTGVFAFIVGLSTNDAIQLTIVSAMPPAVMNTIMASKYGWRPDIVAYVTFILTIPTVLAIPLLELFI
ncbi:MAG: AEC family transporter [Thermosphaera sp.]